MSYVICVNESSKTTHEICISRVTYESCCGWVSHVTHTDELCDIWGWVISHIQMNCVTYEDESFHTYRWIMWHMRMSHFTHTDELCDIWGWVISHI